jgi:pimeloyl-ACP methyl ester carboxylesterase
MDLRHVDIHGQRIGYRVAGEGPVVVLIHGMAGCSDTWEEVIPALSREATVIAPDLIGHGTSSKPRGDYSLGSLASCVRDLLVTLGHDGATVVGHSLGGGVAMQFAYQFPERCERLVLVGSGGLGKEVAFLLRALSAPGAEYVLALACSGRVRGVGTAVTGWLSRVGLRGVPAFGEVWRSYSALGDAETRAAFLHTLRAVVDFGGQRASATDKLYLASEVPTLIVWGDRDPFIPVAHAHAANAAIPGSRVEIFPGSGHFPHRDNPERFATLIAKFMRDNPPAVLSVEHIRERIRLGGTGR